MKLDFNVGLRYCFEESHTDKSKQVTDSLCQIWSEHWTFPSVLKIETERRAFMLAEKEVVEDLSPQICDQNWHLTL
jgi:hypothetical protein